MVTPGGKKLCRSGRVPAATPASHHWTAALRTTRSTSLSSTRRATRTMMRPSRSPRSTCLVASRACGRKIPDMFERKGKAGSCRLISQEEEQKRHFKLTLWYWEWKIGCSEQRMNSCVGAVSQNTIFSPFFFLPQLPHLMKAPSHMSMFLFLDMLPDVWDDMSKQGTSTHHTIR